MKYTEELQALKIEWSKLPQWHEKVVFHNPRSNTIGSRYFSPDSVPNYRDYCEYLAHHNINYLANNAEGEIVFVRDGAECEVISDLDWN